MKQIIDFVIYFILSLVFMVPFVVITGIIMWFVFTIDMTKEIFEGDDNEFKRQIKLPSIFM